MQYYEFYQRSLAEFYRVLQSSTKMLYTRLAYSIKLIKVHSNPHCILVSIPGMLLHSVTSISNHKFISRYACYVYKICNRGYCKQMQHWI